MKVITAVLLTVLAISNALPSRETLKDARFVGDLIAGLIEDISQQLRDNGMDPWANDGADFEYTLPVPVLLDVHAHAKDIAVEGVSNIVINRMDYGLLTFRLDMDVVLPRISITLGEAGVDATVMGWDFDVSANANLVILEPRVAGRVQMNFGIITGIFVREVDLIFTLGGVEFEGEVKVLGTDYTEDFRQLATVTIPNRIKELEADISDMIEIITKEVFDSILN